jgi:hypothetical protein
MVSEGILRRNTPKVGNLFECVATARMEDEKGVRGQKSFRPASLSVSEVSGKLRNWAGASNNLGVR